MGWSARSGITDSLEYRVESVSDLPGAIGGKALKLFSFPGREGVGYEQIIYTQGKKGDVYTIGGWATGQPAAVGRKRRDEPVRADSAVL